VEYVTNFAYTNIPLINNGVAYIPNLTPIKEIDIEYKTPATIHHYFRFMVGEKAGKLMETEWIPK
jgi:hypothetical protein